MEKQVLPPRQSRGQDDRSAVIYSNTRVTRWLD